MHIITPAKKRFMTHSQGRTTPNLISAILYVEPLESIFLKKSLVDFVL